MLHDDTKPISAVRWKGQDVSVKLGKGVVRLAFFRIRALIPRPRRATVSRWTGRAPLGGPHWGCGPSLGPGFQALLKKACVLGKAVAWRACLTSTGICMGHSPGKGSSTVVSWGLVQYSRGESIGVAGLCTLNMCNHSQYNLPGCSSLACLAFTPSSSS